MRSDFFFGDGELDGISFSQHKSLYGQNSIIVNEIELLTSHFNLIALLTSDLNYYFMLELFFLCTSPISETFFFTMNDSAGK